MLHALEDYGFNCVDNFPASMLADYIDQSKADRSNGKLAVTIDIRNRIADLDAVPEVLAKIKENGVHPRVVYLDAQSAVLVKRFSDTRRRHPLDKENVNLRLAMEEESRVLDHMRSIADFRLDSTNLSTHDLVLLTRERLVERSGADLSLQFLSFGYKHGVPVDADFVFDVRCLPNPHWIEELRPFTGRDKVIQEYLSDAENVSEYFDHVCQFLDHWIPIFSSQNRVYMSVAIGCTGGKHRSVFMVERLAEKYREQFPSLLLRHYQLGRE